MRGASKTFVVMKRILFALTALITAVTFCPKPADARVVVVFNGPGYYAPGYYWGPNGYVYYAHPYWHRRFWWHRHWVYR